MTLRCSETFCQFSVLFDFELKFRDASGFKSTTDDKVLMLNIKKSTSASNLTLSLDVV